MAKRPRKKDLPVRIVQSKSRSMSPTWAQNSPWFDKADQLRLNYWRAIRSGEIASSVSAALKAWKDHLHVPRTKRKTIS